MKSKGESVCREVGQAKCCAATRWQEEVKEVKSDFVARLPGGFEVGELLLGGVCERQEFGCFRKGQDPALLLLPHLQELQATDGEASSVWGATSTHPSWGLPRNPGLPMLVVLNAEFPRLYNTEGLVDVDGSE